MTSKYIIAKEYVANKQCTNYSSMTICSISKVTHNRWQCLYQICELKVVKYQVHLDSVCKIKNSTLPWQCIIGKQTMLINYGTVRKTNVRFNWQLLLKITALIFLSDERTLLLHSRQCKNHINMSFKFRTKKGL